jgi:hypothetical protein
MVNMETEKLLPLDEPNQQVIMPSQKQQSWGVVISIVIIVLMIVIGAFYAWGERISHENSLITPTASE